MTRFVQVIVKSLGALLSLLMAVIVIDVTWQVITRFILKNPSSFTEELAGFLLIWIGVLGASYAVYTKAHLGIDLLTSKLKGMKRRVVEVAVYSVVFLFALFVLVLGGVRLVLLSFRLEQISPAIGIRMGYVYLVLPLSGLLMMFFCTVFIAKGFAPSPANPPDRKAGPE